jgi:hypothetical protein
MPSVPLGTGTPGVPPPGSGTPLIAKLCAPPLAIAMAVPLVPSTEAGGDAWPSLSKPQQITFPVSAWIAQLQ